MARKSKKNRAKADTIDNVDLEIAEEVRAPLESVIAFDVYFIMLLKKNSKILPHHKAPMRKYAEVRGLKEATKTQFDHVFKSY